MQRSLCGMLRKVCSWGDAFFSFIWLQQVEPSCFNETPEGEPRCSVTYLAGEEEALAKRKGKTLYTHKSHGCGLGGWLSLINRQGTERERGKAGEELLTPERNMWRQRWNYKSKAEFPNLSYKCFFFRLLNYFNLFHHHHHFSAQGSEHKVEPPEQGGKQQ